MSKSIRDIILYVFIVFALTWLCWSISFSFNIYVLRILGSFMPSAVALAFLNKQKNGIKSVLCSMTFRIKPYIYIFIFLFSLCTVYIPSFICSAFSLRYSIMLNNSIGGINLNSIFMLPVVIVCIFFFGGPLGEEFGWRGYLLRELNKQMNPLYASIIVGIVWSLWHIPMFLFNVEGYSIIFGIYMLQTICMSVIYTWLYVMTHGNLLPIFIFHTIDDFVMAVFLPSYVQKLNAYSISYFAVLIIFSAILGAFLIKKKTQKESINN